MRKSKSELYTGKKVENEEEKNENGIMKTNEKEDKKVDFSENKEELFVTNVPIQKLKHDKIEEEKNNSEENKNIEDKKADENKNEVLDDVILAD